MARSGSLTHSLLLLGLIGWPAWAISAQDASDNGESTRFAQAEPPLATFADFGSLGGGRHRELVGLRINGRENPRGIELLRDGVAAPMLPLRALALEIGLLLGEEVGALRLETPLGAARFLHRELYFGDDEAYAPLPLIAQRLAAAVELDERSYAIVIELPWPMQLAPGSSADTPVQPDVDAPGVDLARLRGQVWWQHDDVGQRRGSQVEAGGRLGPGSWQVRQSTQSGAAPRWHDYHWRLRRGDWLGQIGHQLIGNHPLLPSFELTGVQGAWSNAPERLYSPSDPERLVADRPGAVRSFRGEGPPAGVAELRVDGRTVERQRIALDGRFEFLNIAMPFGEAEVEILLFEHEGSAVPEVRLDYSARASDRLLGPGERLLHGGFGRDGNVLDDLQPARGSGGFVRGRGAIGERLTVEANVQSSAAGDHALASADAGLGRLGIGSAAYARGNGASAWLLGLDGSAGAVFWRGYATDQSAGYRFDESPGLREHSAEVGWRRWPRWELSVLARRRSGDGETIDFVKPALRLRPLSGLFLQARPDYAGAYVYDLEWQPHRDWRAAWHRDRSTDQVRVDHRWSSRWQASLATTRDRQIDRRRDSAGIVYQQADLYGWYAEAGLMHAEGDLGFLARVGRELVPGIQLRLEAIRDPMYRNSAAAFGTSAQLSLLFDLGRAGGGRFTRGGGPARNHSGALGGAIVGLDGDAIGRAGVVVRINGQPRARTDAQGRFHVAGLAPGVYRVELDEEGLPIEWAVSDDGRRWAQVAVGAVTSVRFPVLLRLGLAGRVAVADGLDVSKLTVAVFDSEQRRIDQAQPSEFGDYRIDGLAPGSYTVRLMREEQVLVERPAQIRSEFLFEQDLAVPGSPATAEE